VFYVGAVVVVGSGWPILIQPTRLLWAERLLWGLPLWAMWLVAEAVTRHFENGDHAHLGTTQVTTRELVMAKTFGAAAPALGACVVAIAVTCDWLGALQPWAMREVLMVSAEWNQSSGSRLIDAALGSDSFLVLLHAGVMALSAVTAVTLAAHSAARIRVPLLAVARAAAVWVLLMAVPIGLAMLWPKFALRSDFLRLENLWDRAEIDRTMIVYRRWELVLGFGAIFGIPLLWLRHWWKWAGKGIAGSTWTESRAPPSHRERSEN
jgi:hypothetical protein